MKQSTWVTAIALIGTATACTDDGTYGGRSQYGYVPSSYSGTYAAAPSPFTSPVYASPVYSNRAQAGYGGSADRNRDGIPDRRQRDRDGDGIPNNRDAAPNNPFYR